MISIIWAGALLGMPADGVTIDINEEVVAKTATLGSININWIESTSSPQTYDINMRTGDTQSVGDKITQGRVTLNTSVVDDTVVLEDHWEFSGRVFDLKMTCLQDACLSVQRSEIGIVHEDQRRLVSVKVADGVASFTGDGLAIETPCPSGTVAQTALFRIVPHLPREPGQIHTFAGMNLATDLRIVIPVEGEQFRIEYTGSEAITVEDGVVACARFDVTTDRTMSYFVDGESRVRRMVDGQVTMDLVTVTTAVSAGESP